MNNRDELVKMGSTLARPLTPTLSPEYGGEGVTIDIYGEIL
jgi:hypothetical protein